MPPKKSCQLTVMIDEETRDRLAALAFVGDVTPSDVVRSSMLVGLPLLEERPSLISIVPTMPTSGNRGDMVG